MPLRRAGDRYEPTRPIPPGYVVEERARKGFVISGAIVFVLSYGLSLYATAATAEQDSLESGAWLALPVLGPWIAAATLGDGCRGDVCTDTKALAGIYVFDGIAQVAGVTLLSYGLISRSKWLVPGHHGLRVGPTPIGLGGYGVGASGRF